MPRPDPAPLNAVLIGTPKPFGPKGQPSAMDRHPVDGAVTVAPDGLAGDQVGDPRVHGGAEKAVHHYPHDHYAAWAADAPDIAWRLAAPGAFGENLSVTGWTEANMCIGDIVAWGPARLQISQARQPCWKLNVRFERKTMAKDVERTGRTGWYYRVLEGGTVAVETPLAVIDRPQPDWPLTRLKAVLDGLESHDALAAAAVLPELADGHRRRAEKRLKSGSEGDQSARLVGPTG